MTPTLFRAIGTALYGPQWQSEMARQLDVALRTVQRWSAGSSPVPDSIRPELRTLMDEQRTLLVKLIDDLEPATFLDVRWR